MSPGFVVIFPAPSQTWGLHPLQACLSKDALNEQWPLDMVGGTPAETSGLSLYYQSSARKHRYVFPSVPGTLPTFPEDTV